MDIYSTEKINVREYRRDKSKKDNPKKPATLGTQDEETGNIGYTRRRNRQHWVHKTKKNHNTICDGHHYVHINSKNIKTENVKTHDRSDYRLHRKEGGLVISVLIFDT